jgi:hypothetical protein
MKRIRETFPEDYLKVYAYLFYMSCWDGRNTYLNLVDEERELAIVEDQLIDFSMDNPVIVVALEKCRKLYETPAVRAFRAAKGMADKVATYLNETTPTSGKFSNVPDIDKFMMKLPDYIDTYNKIGEKLKTEQSKVRGAKELAYDLDSEYKNLKD